MQTNVQQMRERLDAAMVGLRTALDPERRKAALADVLAPFKRGGPYAYVPAKEGRIPAERSEEHTSELQSQSNLVCRLLLEKKKKKQKANPIMFTNKL